MNNKKYVYQKLDGSNWMTRSYPDATLSHNDYWRTHSCDKFVYHRLISDLSDEHLAGIVKSTGHKYMKLHNQMLDLMELHCNAEDALTERGITHTPFENEYCYTRKYKPLVYDKRAHRAGNVQRTTVTGSRSGNRVSSGTEEKREERVHLQSISG